MRSERDGRNSSRVESRRRDASNKDRSNSQKANKKDVISDGLPVLRFGDNWNNKLQCDYFTVIRKEKEGLYDYYVKRVDEEFQIRLKGRDYCKAILVDAIRYTFGDLNPAILVMDSGEFACGIHDTSEGAGKVYNQFGIGLGDNVILMIMKRSDRQRKRRFRTKLGV